MGAGALGLEDLEQEAQRLDVLAASERRSSPWLLVHGTEDETVPVDEARRLAERASGEASLLEVDGAGHTFGARHPFAGPTRELIEAMNATQTWFRRHLG